MACHYRQSIPALNHFLDQLVWNLGPGAWHEPVSALPDEAPTAHPVRLIAYYLPQFHACSVNDQAWGKGFTEWTNVTRALPRVAGQVQPRLPADLGFYDLSHKEAIAAQAALARRAGVWGFCIHDYWFSGEKVLETPLRIILDNPDLDLRFCLNWANENWTRRWDGAESDVILAQKYAPGDAEAYIDSIAPAMRDPRYIRVDGRPLLMLYRPDALPDPADTVTRWRARAREIGLGELYLITPQAFNQHDPRPWGFDAAAGFPPHRIGAQPRIDTRWQCRFDPLATGLAFSYDVMAEHAMTNRPTEFRLLPGVCPSWDNEPRKPGNGHVQLGATPAKYGHWLRAAMRNAMEAPEPERIVFINAWNEWAEGAILEPDRHYGHAWLAETRRALDAIAADPRVGEGAPWPEDDRTPERFQPLPRWSSYLLDRGRAVVRRLGLR
jgi:lipopolysaccharide biosynthesis protein